MVLIICNVTQCPSSFLKLQRRSLKMVVHIPFFGRALGERERGGVTSHGVLNLEKKTQFKIIQILLNSDQFQVDWGNGSRNIVFGTDTFSSRYQPMLCSKHSNTNS